MIGLSSRGVASALPDIPADVRERLERGRRALPTPGSGADDRPDVPQSAGIKILLVSSTPAELMKCQIKFRQASRANPEARIVGVFGGGFRRAFLRRPDMDVLVRIKDLPEEDCSSIEAKQRRSQN